MNVKHPRCQEFIIAPFILINLFIYLLFIRAHILFVYVMISVVVVT